MCFAEGNGLFVGEFSCGRGEEDEGFVPQSAGGDDAAVGQRVICGQDGNEGLGEEGLDVESIGWVAVAEKSCVESAIQQTCMT
jgi:hypothetical protein